jgi:DNA-binding transcriptional LysR family regulator
MKREQLADLAAFVAVAQERSFTRAAAKLGVTQSSLSHTIRRLESHLGLRLLARTTRSVAPTAAGERLLRTLGPAFEEIDAELDSLSELREKPSGSIRITTAEHAAETLLMPALDRLLPEYPDVKVEITVDYGLTDVVAERYDAGVRLGEQVAKDMVAVRIGPDMRMAAVAAPSYFAKRRPPRVPQDLADHQCINLRLPTSGGLYAWEFEKAGREVKVRVDGYHLYYPSRRQSTPAFGLIVERFGIAVLRQRAAAGCRRAQNRAAAIKRARDARRRSCFRHESADTRACRSAFPWRCRRAWRA